MQTVHPVRRLPYRWEDSGQALWCTLVIPGLVRTEAEAERGREGQRVRGRQTLQGSLASQPRLLVDYLAREILCPPQKKRNKTKPGRNSQLTKKRGDQKDGFLSILTQDTLFLTCSASGYLNGELTKSFHSELLMGMDPNL